MKRGIRMAKKMKKRTIKQYMTIAQELFYDAQYIEHISKATSDTDIQLALISAKQNRR